VQENSGLGIRTTQRRWREVQVSVVGLHRKDTIPGEPFTISRNSLAWGEPMNFFLRASKKIFEDL
jgi:hypothetical protein